MPKLADYPLSCPQAAEYLGIHEDTLKRWAADGRVRCFRTPSRRWRFNQSDLDDFLSPSPIAAIEPADGDPIERPA